MTQHDYDIIIIGSGPAGATAARLLSPAYHVLLIDNDGIRPAKTCGGLLAPDAQRALAGFDLTLPKSILVGPQIFAVRTIDLASGRQAYYPRSYINLDRQLFDRWLVSLIPARVDIVAGHCLELGQDDDDAGYWVRYTNKSGECRHTARVVIGADGANSLVRRTFAPDCQPTSYTAIQQWFAATEQNPFYSCVFDPLTSESCSWSIFKDNSFIFGGAFTAKNCREMFELQKQRLEPFGFCFGKPLKTEACQVLRPRRPGDFCLGRGNVFLAGEAAGLISPSSLEGISSAILSGTWLAQAINPGLDGAATRYAAATRGLRAKLLAKTAKRWFMYTPLPRRMIMASGLQAIRLHEGQ